MMLDELTSLSTMSCPTTWSLYLDHRLPWRHSALCIFNLRVLNY